MSTQPHDPVRVLYVGVGLPRRDADGPCRQAGPEIQWIEVQTPQELDSALWSDTIDLVVSELAPWGGDPLEVIAAVRTHGAARPIIIVTAHGSEDWAVEAMKRGAVDYISSKAPGYRERLSERIRAVARGVATLDVCPTDLQSAANQGDFLFAQSMNLCCIVGFDGRMKRWNPVWNNALGYSHDEMMSLQLSEIVTPGDLAEALEQLSSGRIAHGMEARIRCKDGSYKWILWDAVPGLDQQAFFVTGQDITSRKATEDELRESQERFQLIASATKEAVWDWDLRTDRVWRNEAFRQLFGAPDDAGVGTIEWWRQRIHPEDRERILASIPAPIVAGHQQWVMEYRLRRLNGTYAQVFDRGFVIFDRDGEPVRMVGSMMDISELKSTEEKLRESEERFALAAKATRDAVWDWDLRKAHVWRSDGFQSLFGYAREEIDSDVDWWIDRIHPDDRPRVLAQVPAPGPANSQQSAFEYRFRRRDGTYADVFDRGFVMFNAEGKPVRMVGSIMDMSERRRAEELVHVQRAELAHIARVSTMGEIATGLAHELNQPLTAITNYAESCARLIASNAPDRDEKLLSWIEKIASNTHRAGEMIRRLRGFTRKSEPRRSAADVNELVEEVIDLMEAETRQHGVRLRWDPAEEAYATVDRVQIQQVLVNLLRNALEAMAANEPQDRQVTIVAAPAAGMVEISVEDLGEGIPPEYRDRVFEAFFTSKPSGVGIGLSISRSIVEDHGGRLWVSPNLQQGVTFHFTLPMTGVPHGSIAHSFGG